MFRGIKKIKIDTKGRMAMPTKTREQLTEVCGGQTILTASPDGCLAMYPVAEFEKIQYSLSKLPATSKRAARLKRLLIAHATDLEWDSQGRVVIPPELREYAGIQKSVAMVGQIQKFEIWDEQTWNSRVNQWKQDELEEKDETTLEALDELVF